ncbi:very short patch repair endonuclease [Noviherbaspirillum album]|uniref:very short patch repair endonuclease n=1 Tax=Noviherbaspirillum album TaxID=3080276 RepID=UPI0034611BCB
MKPTPASASRETRAPTPQRSATMRAVKSRGNTTTEVRMAKILREHRISGWRRHWPIAGTPDFAFPKEKVAVMTHGCFWHGCPKHYRRPIDNASYWAAKVERNMKRDRLVRGRLRRTGWAVLTFWEHDLKCSESVAARIRRSLEKRGRIAA